MAADDSIKSIDPQSPYYLHPASNTNLIISPVVLREDNYGEWARSVRNAFKANNKVVFLDGTIKQPDVTSANYSQWVQVQSMLGAWIHNTLDASIRPTVPLTDDVKDMWADIKQRFSLGN
ncbi:Retrovirus-related Pol polyprotein from transposon RE2, partial [Bienertia sinuspersici]